MTGTVRLLESAEDPLYWPALELYVESFPRAEREPLGKIAAVAAGRTQEGDRAEGSLRRFAAAEVDGKFAGLLYFMANATAEVGYFVFVAVEPAMRRQGIGRRLLDFGVSQCRKDLAELNAGLQAVLFECERPELAEGEERRTRERRLAWFSKQGAIRISGDYTQPAMAEDREPVPLVLMAFPFRGGIDWIDTIERFHRDVLGLPPNCDFEVRTKRALETT